MRLFCSSVSLQEIQEWCKASTPGSPHLVLALLDWSVVMSQPEDEYCGHFVVVNGATDQGISLHNPDATEASPYNGAGVVMPVDLFESARTTVGTDEDLIFIRRATSEEGKASASIDRPRTAPLSEAEAAYSD
uniref:Uncharacterized protein n=1 Tax=Rhizochromulina marina TaxID=1034831 RepID=A0A7S2RPR1_9STRA|mmetsp:Transcript_19291/g.56138  ORF Transcript_19291/g.56138 Transcript_19291/m.56138 type:complete len:133 (+) Transcript_19291:613-1011(+)